MVNRNFKIALLISFALHVLAMSIFAIVTPVGTERMHHYARIDFLGPILKKTAFEISIENAMPSAETFFWQGMGVSSGKESVEVPVPKQEFSIGDFPEYLEEGMDKKVRKDLEGSKPSLRLE